MKERIGIVLLMIAVASLCLYQLNIKAAGKEEGYKITDIRIYKNTPAWELALAVRRQHTGKIKRIAQKEPQLINYQEPKYWYHNPGPPGDFHRGLRTFRMFLIYLQIPFFIFIPTCPTCPT